MTERWNRRINAIMATFTIVMLAAGAFVLYKLAAQLVAVLSSTGND